MTAVQRPPGLAAVAHRALIALAAATLLAHASAAAAAEDKLVLSGNGMTLTGDHGGGGGAATFLTQLDNGNLIGIGLEYQQIYNSHWSNGVFNGALKLGSSIATTLYTEGHLGGGDTAGESFGYTNVAAGFFSALTPWLSVQLEERYIDIEPSHGHLPKLGLTYHIAQALLASLSYAQSFGGNLDTKLGTARVDYAAPHFSWLIGGAYGPVAPRVLNLIGQTVGPAKTLKEGFIGAGKTFGGADWQLIGDYQDLEGFKRTTITLNCTLHLGSHP